VHFPIEYPLEDFLETAAIVAVDVELTDVGTRPGDLLDIAVAIDCATPILGQRYAA